MQDARRVRIVNANVYCHAFSPYITTATQNIEQITMIPNSYFYYVVDHPRIIPGYNIESSFFSAGRSDLYGHNPLKKWEIVGEPFIRFGDYKTNGTTYFPKYGQMALDLFNHPDFSMMKQTDELNVAWTNTAEDEWFYTGIPWGTNFDIPTMKDNTLSSYDCQGIVNGYSTHLFDPNITWGGNPSFAPYSNHSPDYSAEEYGPWWINRSGAATDKDALQQGIPAGAVGVFRDHSGNHYRMSPQMWSKRMMDLLPKHKRPPPRILFRAKEIPEASSTVTWTAMMELSCTLEIVPNSIGYLPLNLGDMLPCWCGDNMFGIRTAPNGMHNSVDIGDVFSSASTMGMSFKEKWRPGGDSGYNVNTDEYPATIKRFDYLTIAMENYEEDLGNGDVAVGIRAVEKEDANCGPSFPSHFRAGEDNGWANEPPRRVHFSAHDDCGPGTCPFDCDPPGGYEFEFDENRREHLGY